MRNALLQVGSAATAEAALQAISDALSPGGLVLITGFTRAFLHPALMRRVGFDKVLIGSMPAMDSCGDACIENEDEADESKECDEGEGCCEVSSGLKIHGRADSHGKLDHGFGRFQLFVLRKRSVERNTQDCSSHLSCSVCHRELGTTDGPRSEGRESVLFSVLAGGIHSDSLLSDLK